MKYEEAKEIIDCMEPKIGFRYFKDRYALMLLEGFVGDGKSVREMKASRYARLLERPAVKQLASKAGGGALSSADVQWFWPEKGEFYWLTLGTWGDEKELDRGWYQKARKGVNLVLHLNFSGKHCAEYSKHLRGGDYDMNYGCHPVSQKYRTLAWARLDVDIAKGEALIEEIQSDWIREAHEDYLSALKGLKAKAGQPVYANWSRDLGFKSYVEQVLVAHMNHWDEAILAATLWYLSSQLGVKKIAYYGFETGARLKGFAHKKRKPPRSLYTQLPKRFCMEKTTELPDMLANSRERQVKKILKDHTPEFWHLPVDLNPVKASFDNNVTVH